MSSVCITAGVFVFSFNSHGCFVLPHTVCITGDVFVLGFRVYPFGIF